MCLKGFVAGRECWLIFAYFLIGFFYFLSQFTNML